MSSVTNSRVHVRSLLRENWRPTTALALSSLVSGAIEALILTSLSTLALSAATESGSPVPLLGHASDSQLIAIAAFGIGLKGVLAFVMSRQSASVTTQAMNNLRRRMSEAYFMSSWSAKSAMRPGELQELLGTFVLRRGDLANSVANGIGALFGIATLLVTALAVDPVAAVAITTGMLALSRILLPARRALGRRSERASGGTLAFAEALSTYDALSVEMHVFGVRRRMMDKLLHHAAILSRSTHRLYTLRAFVPGLYSCLAYAALTGSLAILVQLGDGRRGAVGSVVLLMLRSLSYGQALQGSAGSIATTAPWLDRATDVILRLEADPQRGELTERGCPLEFDDVSFRYGETEVLSRINVRIGRGERVGVVGPSGAGKSTFALLAIGLLNPTTGSVRVSDGNQRMAFVPQRPGLDIGTLLDNTVFHRESVDENEASDALGVVGLSEFLAARGASPIGAGDGVSGGQAQRISIARALADRPTFLVLDEPSSALDTDADRALSQALDSLDGEATVVVVTHRPSTLTLCKRIIVLEDGRLMADGPLAEVIESNDFLRRMMMTHGDSDQA